MAVEHPRALAVNLDKSNAIVQVWHKVLLLKLWASHEIIDRNIKVVVKSPCSDLKHVNAGVPHGCVLVPTLFHLHRNDMLRMSKINCYVGDSTGDVLYSSLSGISREHIENCQLQ